MGKQTSQDALLRVVDQAQFCPVCGLRGTLGVKPTEIAGSKFAEGPKKDIQAPDSLIVPDLETLTLEILL